MSGRTRKVESQLKEITGEEVASLSDPRIQGLVTITGVRVSPDLAHATVFYSVLAGEDEMAANEGLQSAAPNEPTPQQRVFLDLARNFRSIRARKHQEAICLLTRILAGLEDLPDGAAWEGLPELAQSA